MYNIQFKFNKNAASEIDINSKLEEKEEKDEEILNQKFIKYISLTRTPQEMEQFWK
jgi:hypothetical protein